jgi:hypothetical protein
MRSLLTQKHKLELCESRAAGATTLLHTLGHDRAWRRMSVFALSGWRMRVLLSGRVCVSGCKRQML